MYQLTITKNDEIIREGKFSHKELAILHANTITGNMRANALARSYHDYFAIDKALKVEIKEIA